MPLIGYKAAVVAQCIVVEHALYYREVEGSIPAEP